MLNIGDMVKVISKTKFNNEDTELIPIGTICMITDIGKLESGKVFYEVTPLNNEIGFYYFESEIEKGRMEWVSDCEDWVPVETGNYPDDEKVVEITYDINKNRFRGLAYRYKGKWFWSNNNILIQIAEIVAWRYCRDLYME